MSRSGNILVLITDQQTHHAMSCAGNEWLETPAMDALAARGTRFTRAYCSYPLCSPARASHMTGRYPHEYGIFGNNGYFWGEDIPRKGLLGYALSRAGYRCVWAGKDMAPTDGSRDFELLCQWGDVQTADHLCAFLRDTGDQPFLAVANFVNPHNICEWARGQTLWEGDIGPEPHPDELPPLPANHGVPPYEPSILDTVQRHSDNVLIGRSFTPDRWRRYLWAYYRLVELVDKQVGRILSTLEETGIANQTLVVFMSDHGDGCAAHRWNQKMTFYEEVVRVPMILAGPGLAEGAVCDRLVSTGLDLYPTCCEAAGLPLPDDRDGRSLVALCRPSPPSQWRDAVFIENAIVAEQVGLREPESQRANAGRCLVTKRWKYSVWNWGEPREQLVDLDADPGEMVNLAVCGRYRPRLRQMRARLHDWTQSTNDAFLVPGHVRPAREGNQGDRG